MIPPMASVTLCHNLDRWGGDHPRQPDWRQNQACIADNPDQKRKRRGRRVEPAGEVGQQHGRAQDGDQKDRAERDELAVRHSDRIYAAGPLSQVAIHRAEP